MEKIRKLAKIRVWTGYLYILVAILLAKPTSAFLVVGSIICIIGLIIRILAAGSLVKAEELITGGIYQMTRNPLYLGSFFIGIGITIMSGQLYLIILYFVIFIPLYHIMIKTEEGFLLSAFGKDFEDYVARVPRWFPAPGAPPGLLVNFSLKKYNANRELPGNLAIIVIALIFWLFWYLQVKPILMTIIQ